MTAHATATADWVLILPVALCLAGAALLLMLRGQRSLQSPLALMVIAGVILSDTYLFARVVSDGPVSMTMGNWLPPFGISFTADVLGAGFALLAAAVTFITLLYAQADSTGHDGADSVHALVVLLLGGVSGSFLTGDLFNLYVWFEVVLIATFGLLVVRGRTIEIDATVKYGFLNFLATTFFLIALGLLYGQLGTLNMADIGLRAGVADPAAMTPTAGLLLLAFGMKAAAFPVNTWLPSSYHAPSPAVAALLAGMPTKVGMYALIRTLGGVLPLSRDALEPVLAAVAVATLVVAPLGAIAETNLRRALGFVVIGGIGAAMAGLAVGGSTGLQGATFYVAHAIATMTALYLVAGLLERITGETDTRRMGGLYTANSLISILFLVLILAAAGVPPFLGFWPKLLLVQAGLEAGAGGAFDVQGAILTGAILLNALLTLIAGSRIWSHVFWREGPIDPVPGDPVGLRRLVGREAWFGLGAATALTLVLTVLGLMPDIFFRAAGIAAADLVDPARYVAAVGLGETP